MMVVAMAVVIVVTMTYYHFGALACCQVLCEHFVCTASSNPLNHPTERAGSRPPSWR